MSDIRQKDVGRFFRHVIKSDGCWLWQGSTVYDGYGMFGICHKSKRSYHYVHRIAFEIYFGAIPDNLLVCHTCDVKNCVNPAHLFLGTHFDNWHDAEDKGRAGHINGKFAQSQDLHKLILSA